MDIQAEVVWAQQNGLNLLVGLRKMSLSGLLKHYPLSDILLDLEREDVTECLR